MRNLILTAWTVFMILPGYAAGEIRIRTLGVIQNGESGPMQINFSPPLGAGDGAVVRISNEIALKIAVERGEIESMTARLRYPNNREFLSVTRVGSIAEEASQAFHVLITGLIPPRYQGSSVHRQSFRSDRLTVMLRGNGLTDPMTIESDQFKAVIEGNGYVAENSIIGIAGKLGESEPKIVFGAATER
ncbi:MAG: hypothetical protein OEL88_16065 [Sterolibacteriaceae bacterium MAG5]|nr:hypothetical protein [Candidatus Nitricoxidireducens bremensis]